MDTLLDSIRAAITDGATDDTKRAGADACRAILAALDATPVAPLAVAQTAPDPDRPHIPPTAAGIATAIAALRNIPGDQLLDLAIAKLRALIPTEGAPTPPAAFRVPLVPLPVTRDRRGDA